MSGSPMFILGSSVASPRGRRLRRAVTIALVLSTALLSTWAHAQDGNQVFPGAAWESVWPDTQALQAYGWSPVGLR
jgi:hypothetical protein